MSNFLVVNNICNRSVVPVLDHGQLIYVLMEIVPGESLSASRMPLNFALVLDRSGSMAGPKLRTMKEAVKSILNQLQGDDIISIITFETKSQVLIEAQPAVDKAKFNAEVDKIREGGGTNMAQALRQGLEQVRRWHRPDRVSRIVLLTDGEATDSEDDSRRLADEAGQLGIPIISLGFGSDWNEEFLFDLSDRSVLGEPGSHVGMADYIPNPEDALHIFQEVYQSMQVVARDVTLTIRMVQGLEARKVWQVVPMIRDLGFGVIQGRSIVVPLGQLERAGAAFLVEMMLPPRPEGMVRIAQTEVSYLIPQQGIQVQRSDLILNFTKEAAQIPSLNPRVMNIVEKVQAFKLQTQALAEAEMGDVPSATRKLRQAVTLLLAQGETELAEQMQSEADHLEQMGAISSEGKKTIKLTSRKTVRLSDE